MAGEAQREALRIALYTLLSTDAQLTALAPGGVWDTRTPQGPGAPATSQAFVCVRYRPGGRIIHTLGRARAMRYVNVEIVGIVPGAGSITADRIDERLHELVDYADLVLVDPWTCGKPARVVDINDPAVVSGRECDVVGGLYRFALSGWRT